MYEKYREIALASVATADPEQENSMLTVSRLSNGEVMIAIGCIAYKDIGFIVLSDEKLLALRDLINKVLPQEEQKHESTH